MANSYILLADLKAELRYCGCQATEVLGGKKLNKGSMWLKKVTKENHLFLLLKLHTKLTTPIVKLFTVFSVIALFSVKALFSPFLVLTWHGATTISDCLTPCQSSNEETTRRNSLSRCRRPTPDTGQGKKEKKKKKLEVLSLSLSLRAERLPIYLWTIVISSTFIYFWESFCVWVWLLKLNNFY